SGRGHSSGVPSGEESVESGRGHSSGVPSGEESAGGPSSAVPSGTATIIRVYGANDDPKRPLSSATWLDLPILEAIANLRLDPDLVWPDIPLPDRTLWNAALFPAGSPDFCWSAVQWFLGQPGTFTLEHWLAAPRHSLASSARWADPRALSDAALRRAERQWTAAAVALAESGGDVRALVARPPAIASAVRAGRALIASAAAIEPTAPTEAASRYYQASLFLALAGLSEEQDTAKAKAFKAVRQAVESGTVARPLLAAGMGTPAHPAAQSAAAPSSLLLLLPQPSPLLQESTSPEAGPTLPPSASTGAAPSSTSPSNSTAITPSEPPSTASPSPKSAA
ncbi:MAG TPA: hypothetical protein VN428_11380, partial [Bryobacteraceae bacterium]|nr:hypothetical protein [Bryobacteraceae bacterium]